MKEDCKRSTPPVESCSLLTGTRHQPNIQYADDLTVCAESRGDLQSMLLVLNISCTEWGMKINGKKTKVLSIGEAGDDHPPITLNGQIIEEVDSFSYLGSEVDKMGKVEKEVGVRLEKAATVYHMWRRKVFRSRILTKDTKMRAFRLMVMSVLLYGAVVTQHNIRRLKTFQMRCLRDILGLTLLDRRRNIDILQETGELPIEHQLRKKRLQWFGHHSRMPDHRIAKQLLRCRPRGKRRKPGGTSQRWVDLISRDLSNVDNWQQTVQNRKEWRSVVHGESTP